MTFISACAIITAGGFLSGVAPNFASLIVFRTVVGFGVGGALVPFDLLAEFTPDSTRGER